MSGVLPEFSSFSPIADAAHLFAESALAFALAARIRIPKTTLRLLYDVLELSTRDVAEFLRVSPELVRRELHRHDVPVRRRGRPSAVTTEEVERLAELYWDEEHQPSLEAVAALAPNEIVDGSHLGKIFDRFGVEKRPRGRLRGKTT